MSEVATKAPVNLIIGEKSLELPIVSATVGSDGIAVSSLLKETGLVTVDPGFVNTAACSSKVTYIDGDAGILRYRGYPIEQLAEHSTFFETSYLLIHGELPTADQLEAFESRIKKHTLLHEDFKQFFTAFPRDGHPMTVLQSAVSALAPFYPHTLDPKDPEQVELASILLLAKVPTMIAYIYRRANGHSLLYPDHSLGVIEDFLRMSFGNPSQPYQVDPVRAKAMDVLLLLHGDHEQNCSTSTVRLVGSSDASIYASISAGVGGLSGPKHGGANEAVLKMLQELQRTGEDVNDFMTKVKDKGQGSRLMGFGHRVYKNYDPRAALVKEIAHQVLAELGGKDELLDIALSLEDIALRDDYFIERRLYPNVDFYTGLIYKAIGFPNEMFTPLFALGRMPGWIAQWREMINDPETKIGRPRQVYTGYDERDYRPIQER